MKTFIIERWIPGAGRLGPEEIRGITAASNEAVAALDAPYEWVTSYTAGDRIYCVHRAESADVIEEHARLGGFPADRVTEVTMAFDADGPRVEAR